MVLNKFQFKVTKQVYSLDAKLWLTRIFKIAKNVNLGYLGNSLGKCQNSGSTTSNQPREKEQACSNKVMEYSRTIDILPTRSSSVAKGYN